MPQELVRKKKSITTLTPDVKAEHLVVFLQGELCFGVGSDVGSVVDGESLQPTLSGHGVVPFNGTVAVKQTQNVSLNQSC